MLNWLPALFLLLVQGSAGPDLGQSSSNSIARWVALSTEARATQGNLSASRHLTACELALLALLFEHPSGSTDGVANTVPELGPLGDVARFGEPKGLVSQEKAESIRSRDGPDQR